MQIHQLRYFCAVARTGSFTRAAQQEHLAQPSLSQQIRKLEDELGTRLFDRLGRSVRLTQPGEAFLPRAEGIIRELADAKTEIQEMDGAKRGRLVIGAIPTIAPYFLPSCLASFAQTFPRVQISVVEEVTTELLNRVHQRGDSPKSPACGISPCSPRTNCERSLSAAEGGPLLSRKHSGRLRTCPVTAECGF